jgi:hypothetical protein
MWFVRSPGEIREVRLRAPAAVLPALADYYVDGLGFTRAPATPEVAIDVGRSRLSFVAASAGTEPFYHFAFLAPGDRFRQAQTWFGARAELLPGGSDGKTTFPFERWDALACYALDPAGNIVEVISHAGLACSGRTGAFEAGELVGLSEVGLVLERPAEAVEALAAAGVPLWDGGVEGPTDLGFVGSKARTLILSGPGRGWLPTGRPAEFHALDVEIETPVGDPVRVSVDDRGAVTTG